MCCSIHLETSMPVHDYRYDTIRKTISCGMFVSLDGVLLKLCIFGESEHSVQLWLLLTSQ